MRESAAGFPEGGRPARPLVRLGPAHAPDQVLHVELRGDELLGEQLQQFRVRGGIGRPKIVRGINQSAAHEMIPDAIHLHARECAIGCEPHRERIQRCVRFGTRFAQKSWHGVFPGAQVLYRPDARGKDDLLALPFVLVAADVAFVLDHLVIHPREERRPIVVIVLRPALVGMIVALGALQARSQKHLRRGFRARDRIAIRPVVVRRGTVISAAARNQDFTGESVQRFVFSDALADPMMKVLHAFLVQRMRFHAQKIRPTVLGEFDDSTLLKVVGEAGWALFPVPSAIAHDVTRQYRVRRIGQLDRVRARFYAISVERRMSHPALVAISAGARRDLFR